MSKSTLNISPIGDRIFVEQDPAETTVAGYAIPETAQEKPLKGTVVAIGPGSKRNPMTLKNGARILFGRFSGTEFKHEGKSYLIMRESDVYATLNQ